MTKKNYDYDYLVIGAGSGGIASANRAGMRGAKVALIEGSEVGGTCVNLGCVPKKVLWNGVSILEQMQHFAADYGMNVEFKGLDFKKLVEARQAYIDRIHTSYGKGFEGNKVDFIQGWGEIKDPHTVVVKDPHTYEVVKTLSAERILLSPGAKPSLPNIEGAEYGIDSDGFFALTELPKSALVVGAGYIAVEVAGVFNSFGVETTLLTRGDLPLRWADADLNTRLVKAMTEAGVKHIPHADITKVTKATNTNAQGEKEELITLHFKDGSTVSAECLLWAIGRHPNTKGLGLENTAVEVDDKGFILTDEYNQTKEPSIFAIGDATHMPALTPVAIKAGRLLAERLFNNMTNAHYNAQLVPTVIFSHPPIGTIGLSEEKARAQYGDYNETNPQGIRVYKSSFTSMISAITSHRQMVFMKLVTQGPNEKVIGLHGIGHGVDEMIQGFAVAMNMGATKADFDNTVAIHPTGSEEFVTMR